MQERPRLAPDVEQQTADRRMQVHVLVRVGMASGRPVAAKAANCGADLGGELTADARTDEIVEAEPELGGRELSGAVSRSGIWAGGKDGRALDHDEVEADVQGRMRRARRTASAGGGPATMRLAG